MSDGIPKTGLVYDHFFEFTAKVTLFDFKAPRCYFECLLLTLKKFRKSGRFPINLLELYYQPFLKYRYLKNLVFCALVTQNFKEEPELAQVRVQGQYFPTCSHSKVFLILIGQANSHFSLSHLGHLKEFLQQSMKNWHKANPALFTSSKKRDRR